MVRRVVLASASPRRKELLKLIVADFEVIKSDIAEPPLCGEPGDCVMNIAAKKAEYRAAKEKDAIIIAADTCVYKSGVFLGKPKNEADAARMLALLSGNTHTVYTGVCVIDTRTGVKKSFYSATDVTFAQVSEAETAAYIATGEPMDKAGAYGAQGYAARFVASISGEYYNVIGLPVRALYAALRELEEADGEICTIT